jgi:hypothetical protein
MADMMDPIAQMFSVGRAFSEKIEVLPGVRIIFRVLSPREQIEVGEAMQRHSNGDSRFLEIMLQTLARAIYVLNDGMALILDQTACDDMAKTLGRQPNRVDQAYHILSTKVERPVVELMYTEYMAFYAKLYEGIDELKKKLKPVPPGEQTSKSASTSGSSQPTIDSKT